MEIAIISDIHDNILNLDKVLFYLKDKRITTLFCCGDFGSEDTLKYLVNKFQGKIYAVMGNMDNDYSAFTDLNKKYKVVTLAENENRFSLQGKEILLVHEPSKYKKYLSDKNLQYIFHGHTHKPWQSIENNKMILCPGNVANQIFAPSFAIWNLDDNKFDLIILNSL